MAVLLLFCGFLAGADAFTYSNPIVKRGNLYYKKGKHSKSLEMYLKAAKSVKDEKSVNFNIGSACYKTNDFENALKYFERSLKTADNIFNAKVMFNMGNCYFKEGELIKAYDKYKASLKLDPVNRDAKYNLEFVLSMIEKNKKRKSDRQGDKQRNSRKRSGKLQAGGDPNFYSGDKKQDEMMGKEDFDSKINFSDNFDSRDDLDEISKNDALQILSALTEQVIMRTPMREDPLTKKGEYNEKDW
jgi:Ca-activated chloride channel family protein